MSDWTELPDAHVLGDELVLHDLETLKELTNPTRSSILYRLRTPHSAAELAAEMQVPVTRLYHHINRLEELGLIKVVATRRSGATTERRYRIATEGLRVEPDATRGRTPTEVAAALGALFDVTRTEIANEVESGHLHPERFEGRAMVAFMALSLTDQQRRDFVRRLDDLIEEYNALNQPTGEVDPDATRFRLFVAAFGLTT